MTLVLVVVALGIGTAFGVLAARRRPADRRRTASRRGSSSRPPRSAGWPTWRSAREGSAAASAFGRRRRPARARGASRVRDEERRERERESWEVVTRLSTVLAGGAAKGRAGENLLREHLAQLPPGMLVTDLRVNGRVVEFGLLLPDGRRLPIDSKWSAVAELEALEGCDDPAERETWAREVERQVALRAREVAQYLDPALTAPVAVAAVPDAAYAVLRRAHADAFARGVVVVPYSTAMPVLLFLYSLADRFGDAGDAQGCIAEVASLLDAMESVIENKIAQGVDDGGQRRRRVAFGDRQGAGVGRAGPSRPGLGRRRTRACSEPFPRLRAWTSSRRSSSRGSVPAPAGPSEAFAPSSRSPTRSSRTPSTRRTTERRSSPGSSPWGVPADEGDPVRVGRDAEPVHVPARGRPRAAGRRLARSGRRASACAARFAAVPLGRRG